MAEGCGNNKYIICSKCKCKYSNNGFNILKDFGYNRLGEQFKTCKKCRLKKKQEVKQTNETTNKEPKNPLENAPTLALLQYNIPEYLIKHIMGFHGEVCDSLPQDVYLKYKNNIQPFIKYIRPNNFQLEEEQISAKGGLWGDFYIKINISKNMISSIIKNKKRLFIVIPLNLVS